MPSGEMYYINAEGENANADIHELILRREDLPARGAACANNR